MESDELREQLADLTRDGSVVLVNPELPGSLKAFQPESVDYWLRRGWERYEPPAPKVDKPAAKSAPAKAKAAEGKD